MKFIAHISVCASLLSLSGCSYYTLDRACARDAGSHFSEGKTYRVVCPTAVLVHASSRFGFGAPDVELAIQSIPQIGRTAIVQVPLDTDVKLDRFVRFRQHGLYDCGYDGSLTVISEIPSGPLRGWKFLIQPSALDDLLLARPVDQP